MGNNAKKEQFTKDGTSPEKFIDGDVPPNPPAPCKPSPGFDSTGIYSDSNASSPLTLDVLQFGRKGGEVDRKLEEFERGFDEEAAWDHPSLDPEIKSRIMELRMERNDLKDQVEALHFAKTQLTGIEFTYRMFFDFVPVAILRLDENLVILDANREAVRLMGVPRNHIIKKPFLVYFEHGFHQIILEHTHGFLFHGDETQFLAQIQNPAGIRKIIQVFISILRGDPDQTEYLLALVDITEITQLQDQLQEQNEVLQGEIREKEAIQAQLKTVIQQVNRANEAKSDFLANMSHEFRTPLNIIMGFADLLLADPGAVLSEKQERYIGDILETGEHLVDLVSNLIDLRAIERGEYKIRVQEFDLYTLIQRVEKLFKKGAEEKQVTLDLPQEKDPLLIRTDKTKLTQVLFNLLSNAIKFNKPGGAVSLRVDYSRSGVELTVKDTGRGISPKDRGKLFEMFSQLQESGLNDPLPGSGIGLYFSKHLIRILGGEMWMESEEDVGTTFGIRFPPSLVVQGDQ